MVLVTMNVYDEWVDGDDGNLTEKIQQIDTTTKRINSFADECRDRRVDTDGEIAFFQGAAYDHLCRVIDVRRDDTPASAIPLPKVRSSTMTGCDCIGLYSVAANWGETGSCLTDMA
jgi:hypothetical protein